MESGSIAIHLPAVGLHKKLAFCRVKQKLVELRVFLPQLAQGVRIMWRGLLCQQLRLDKYTLFMHALDISD